MTSSFSLVLPVFKRIDSLTRLLSSINFSSIPVSCDLIFSIDQKATQNVIEYIKDVEWSKGKKKLFHCKNSGLNNNIINCYKLGSLYDYFFLLEDDTFVHPQFFQYALDSINEYQKNKSIAGYSLYRYQLNTITQTPHYLFYDCSFTFFLQKPCPWGSFYSKSQALDYIDYVENQYKPKSNNNLPTNVLSWGDDAWERIFYQFLLETGKTFVYPLYSFSTVYAEVGTHFKLKDLLLRNQSCLIGEYKSENVYFAKYEDCINVFDIWFQNTRIKSETSPNNTQDRFNKDLGIIPREANTLLFKNLEIDDWQKNQLNKLSNIYWTRVGMFDVALAISYKEILLVLIRKLKRNFIALYTTFRNRFEKD